MIMARRRRAKIDDVIVVSRVSGGGRQWHPFTISISRGLSTLLFGSDWLSLALGFCEATPNTPR
jgi:hypothetical protein